LTRSVTLRVELEIAAQILLGELSPSLTLLLCQFDIRISVAQIAIALCIKIQYDCINIHTARQAVFQELIQQLALEPKTVWIVSIGPQV
jgi:hypothetical protein